jgi:hypothetical protein
MKGNFPKKTKGSNARDGGIVDNNDGLKRLTFR